MAVGAISVRKPYSISEEEARLLKLSFSFARDFEKIRSGYLPRVLCNQSSTSLLVGAAIRLRVG